MKIEAISSRLPLRIHTSAPSSIYRCIGKRLFDILVVSLTSPIWIIVLVVAGAIAYACHDHPIIFSQKRAGMNGKIFKSHKFRSMNNDRDGSGRLLPDSQRLTAVGKLFRCLSIDEFPMIINVLRGEMSIVGPRPLLPEYLDRYSPEQARRHEVMPGITGSAQVNGRNTLDWKERFDHDVWYVDNVSFRLDLQILALTVWKVIKREGISQAGRATMAKFMGGG